MHFTDEIVAEQLRWTLACSNSEDNVRRIPRGSLNEEDFFRSTSGKLSPETTSPESTGDPALHDPQLFSNSLSTGSTSCKKQLLFPVFETNEHPAELPTNAEYCLQAIRDIVPTSSTAFSRSTSIRISTISLKRPLRPRTTTEPLATPVFDGKTFSVWVRHILSQSVSQAHSILLRPLIVRNARTQWNSWGFEWCGIIMRLKLTLIILSGWHPERR